jgi:hypothetical protein
MAHTETQPEKVALRSVPRAPEPAVPFIHRTVEADCADRLNIRIRKALAGVRPEQRPAISLAVGTAADSRGPRTVYLAHITYEYVPGRRS